MKRRSIILSALLAAMLPMSAAVADEEGQEYRVDLLPLNASGVYGEVELELEEGKRLTVKMEVMGLEPGKLHPQHIHGLDKPVRDATCPGPEADTDADGLISLPEGLPSFGPIVLPLVPFDLVDDSGRLEYEASFTINPGTLQPLHKRAIVLHGLTVNGEYITSLPVACGEVVKED